MLVADATRFACESGTTFGRADLFRGGPLFVRLHGTLVRDAIDRVRGGPQIEAACGTREVDRDLEHA
jgi:hypothetical protein